MIWHSRLRSYFVIVCGALLSVIAPLATAHSQAPPTKAVPEKPSHAQLADVNGDWDVSWQSRLGSERCVLHLQQDGSKLTGTLKSLRGLTSLAGTVDHERLSFDVGFQGTHPFTVRFTGNADSVRIEGTSQGIGVSGAGAYLGHGGEILHPEHPWTATRVANQPARSPSSSPTTK
jgi:hypothetical protein